MSGIYLVVWDKHGLLCYPGNARVPHITLFYSKRNGNIHLSFLKHVASNTLADIALYEARVERIGYERFYDKRKRRDVYDIILTLDVESENFLRQYKKEVLDTNENCKKYLESAGCPRIRYCTLDSEKDANRVVDSLQCKLPFDISVVGIALD